MKTPVTELKPWNVVKGHVRTWLVLDEDQIRDTIRQLDEFAKFDEKRGKPPLPRVVVLNLDVNPPSISWITDAVEVICE